MNRRTVATIALIVMLLMVFSGCTDHGSSPTTDSATSSTAEVTTSTDSPSEEVSAYYNEPGTLPIVDEMITLTMGMPIQALIEDRVTNEFTLYLEENSNIHLEFEEYPTAEYMTKVDLMMTAGGEDLPDILATSSGNAFDAATITDWGKAGMIVPLNDYFTDLAYYLPLAYNNCNFIDYDTAVMKATSYDGNIYAIPSYSESPNNLVSNGRLVTYSSWLEALDMELPITLDEMRAYLEGVRDNDLNGNGDASDEIPLVGFTGGLFIVKSAFITPFLGSSGHQPWINRDGTIEYTYSKDEYREGLYYIKALIDDGLLSPLTFTQDQAQMTAQITADPYTVGAFMRWSASNLDVTRQADYTWATALAGPDGNRYQGYNPTVFALTYAITMNCEYPETAFLLGDYMGSEENSFINNRGFEGKDWREIDSKTEINVWEDATKPYTLINTSWGQLQNVWWCDEGVSVLNYQWAIGSSITNDPTDFSYILGTDQAASIVESLKYVCNDTDVSGLVYNEEESEIMTDVYTSVETYADECFTRFVLGDLSLDDDWDTYIDTLEQIGLQDCIDAVQSCVDRMGN